MAATAPTFTFSQKDTTDCTQIFVVAMRETRVQSLGEEDPLEKEVCNPLQYSCLENPMEGGAW